MLTGKMHVVKAQKVPMPNNNKNPWENRCNGHLQHTVGGHSEEDALRVAGDTRVPYYVNTWISTCMTQL